VESRTTVARWGFGRGSGRRRAEENGTQVRCLIGFAVRDSGSGAQLSDRGARRKGVQRGPPLASAGPRLAVMTTSKHVGGDRRSEEAARRSGSGRQPPVAGVFRPGREAAAGACVRGDARVSRTAHTRRRPRGGRMTGKVPPRLSLRRPRSGCGNRGGAERPRYQRYSRPPRPTATTMDGS